MACILYKGNKYTQEEFRKLIEQEVVAPKKIKSEKVGSVYVTDEKRASIQDKIDKGLPIKANDIADLYLINRLVFGLNEVEAKANAEIMDRMMKSMRVANNFKIDAKIREIVESDLSDIEKSQKIEDLENSRTNPYNDVYYTTSMGVPDTSLKQIIGEIGAQNNLIIKQNLDVARKMERDGKTSEEIFLATGWERTKDNGKWKYDLLDGSLKNTNRLREVADNSLFKGSIVTNVTYKINNNGTYNVKLINARGKGALNTLTANFNDLKKSELEAFLGKDIASEILQNNGVNITEEYELLYGEKTDNAFQIKKDFNFETENGLILSEVFDAPELYQLYPQLKGIVITVQDISSIGAWNGEYIILPTSTVKGNSVRLRNTLIHEIQHIIQDIEGFAKGGSVDMFDNPSDYLEPMYRDIETLIKFSEENNITPYEVYNRLKGVFNYDDVAKLNKDKTLEELKSLIKEKENDRLTPQQKYNRLAGEVEARNTEKRANMTIEERQQKMLSKTEDVEEGSKVYLYNNSDISLREDIRFQTESQLGQEQDLPHGAVQLFKNGKAIIYAISNPNVTTPLHELAHVFEQYLDESENSELLAFAEQVEGRKLDRNKVEDRVAISEVFSRGFEKYLYDGVAPNKGLQSLFDKFANWLTNIYQQIKGSPIDMELTPQMKSIYSKMLGVKNPTVSSGGANKVVRIDSNGSIEKIGEEVVATNEIDGQKLLEATDSDFDQIMGNSNNDVNEGLLFQTKNTELQSISIEEAVSRNNGNPLYLAPNGKQSLLYQSYKDLGYSDMEAERLVAQVYSDNFKSWFGDWQNDPKNSSKVVDENGQPLVVYHGTGAKRFNIFLPFSYFSNNIDKARQYSNQIQPDGTLESNLYATFLNIKKLKDMPMFTLHEDRLKVFSKTKTVDGVVNPLGNSGAVEIVIKEPNQIKSATGNVGTFDNKKPDIRFQKQGKKKSKKTMLTKLAKSFDDGLIPLKESKYIAEELNKNNPDLDTPITEQDIESILNKTVTVKSNKWVNGRLVDEENRVEVKMTRRDALLNIVLPDKEFDKLKAKIDNTDRKDRIVNEGSGRDVSAAMFFANNYRRRYFKQRGITESMLNTFLMSNKSGTAIGDHEAILNNYAASFENKGTKQERFLGKPVGNNIFTEIFTTATRYLFDSDLPEEVKAYILNAAETRDVQGFEAVDMFTEVLIAQVLRAAEEAAIKELGGKRSEIRIKQLQSEALSQMARMDFIYNMMAQMNTPNGATALEMISRITNSEGAQRVEALDDAVTNGFELVLLSKIIDKMNDLGTDTVTISNAIAVKDKMAMSYGRAIAHLNGVYNAKNKSGQSIMWEARKRVIAAQNDAQKKKVSPVGLVDGKTVEETLDNIGKAAEIEIIDSINDYSDAIDAKKETDIKDVVQKIIDSLSDIGKPSNKQGKKSYDELSDEEKFGVVREVLTIGKELGILKQDKKGDKTPNLNKLVQNIFKNIVRERLSKGLDTDITNKKVQDAIRASMEESLGELADLIGEPTDKVQEVTNTLEAAVLSKFNQLLLDNEQELNKIREKERQIAANKLIVALDSSTKNNGTTNSTIKGNIGRVVARGKSNKAKLENRRQEQIKQKDTPDLEAVILQNINDDAEILFHTIAQANELGVEIDVDMLQDAAYATINSKNAKAIVKQYLNSRKQKGGVVTVGDQITHLSVTLDSAIELALEQIKSDNADVKDVDSVLSQIENSLQEAALDVMAAYELELIEANNERLKREEAKLNALIAKETDAEEKKKAKEEFEQIKAEIKAEEKQLKEAEKERQKNIKQSNKIRDKVKNAKEYADAIQEKANKRAADKIVEELNRKDSKDYKDNLISQLGKDASAAIGRPVDIEQYFDDPTLFPQLTELILSLYGNTKKSNEVIRVAKSKLNEKQKAKIKNSELGRLASKLASKENRDEKEDKIYTALVKLQNGDLTFVSPYDLKLIEDYVIANENSESKRNEILSLINEIKNERTANKRDWVLDEFARILVDVRARKGMSNGSKRNPDGARAQLKEDLAKNAVDVSEIMEARRRLINTTPPNQLGEKLAILDDMLSQIYGRTFGKSNVRAMIKEMVQNKAAITDSIAKLLKDFYANDDNKDAYRSDLEQFIIENTGITDPEIVEEIKKIFNETYNEVWNEERRKRLEQSVDKELRSDLNKANDEVERTQTEFDNAELAYQQGKASGAENLDELKKEYDSAKKALDKAKRNQVSARKNYERIIRKAPSLSALADAMKNGMHRSEEFQERFYEVFGLNPLNDTNAKMLEAAVDKTLSDDEATRSEGYAEISRIMANAAKTGNFWHIWSLNDTWKMNILSSIETVFKSALGAGILRPILNLPTLIAPLARNIFRNIILVKDKAMGKRLEDEFTFEVTKLAAQIVADIGLSVMPTFKRAGEVISKGELSENTADELSRRLTHAHNTIADYVMKGRFTNPFTFASFVFRPDMTTDETLMLLGNLSPEQKIALAEMIDNINGVRNKIVNQLYSNLPDILANVLSKVVKGVSGVFKFVGSAAQYGYTNISEGLKNLSNEYNNDQITISSIASQTKNLFTNIAGELLGLVIRTASTGAVMGNRTLASVDVGNNTLFNNGTRNIVAYLEADAYLRDYNRQLDGRSKIIEKSASILEKGGTLNDLIRFLFSSNISNNDKQIIDAIANNDTYANDDEKQQAIIDYLKGNLNAITLQVESFELLKEQDKSVIYRLLEGKDAAGNDILVDGKKLTDVQKKEYVLAYLLGRGIDGKSWTEYNSEVMKLDDFANRSVSEILSMVGTMPERLMRLQAEREGTFNPELNTVMNDMVGDINYTSEVQGRMGAFQRYLSGIMNAAEARIRRRRILDGDRYRWYNYNNLSDLTSSLALNIFLPLPRAVGQSAKWIQRFLPTNLLQLALIETTDDKGNKVYVNRGMPSLDNPKDLEKYKTKTNSSGEVVFDTFLWMHLPKQWDELSVYSKVKSLNLFNGKYQWRNERRSVAFDKRKGFTYVSNRKLTAMEKLQNLTSILIANGGLAYALSSYFNDMFCFDEKGNKYLKGHPACGCPNGDCDPSAYRITGDGVKQQGSDYERMAIQKYDKKAKKYETVLKYDMMPLTMYMFAWIGKQYEKSVKMEQAHLPLNKNKGIEDEKKTWVETANELYGGAADAIEAAYQSVLYSTGISNTTESGLRTISSISKILGADDNRAMYDEISETKSQKAWGEVARLLANALPIGGANARDLMKMYGTRVTPSIPMWDDVRNQNFWASKLDEYYLGQREREYTAWNTPKKVASLPMYDPNPLPNTEDAKTNDRIDKLINGDYLSFNEFYEPSFSTIAARFERGSDGKNLGQFIEGLNNMPYQDTEKLKRMAREFKRDMITDTEVYSAKDTNERYSISEAIATFSDAYKKEYLRDINNYGNNRAVVEFIYDKINEAGLMTEPITSFLRKQGKGMFKEPLTIPMSKQGKELQVTVPKGVETKYPTLSMAELLDYMAVFGIKIKDGKAIEVKPYESFKGKKEVIDDLLD